MSGTKIAYELSPEWMETFLSTVPREADREAAERIVGLFRERGLPVKSKSYDMACMAGTFRILCFVKKSREAVILNNRGMGRPGFSVQLRIENPRAFERLDGLSPNIRGQILRARDCGYCQPNCEGKRYAFAYQGAEYVKCRAFSVNFFLENFESEDIQSLMELVRGEVG